MKVLVDYNNIRRIFRERGLNDLIVRLTHLINPETSKIYDRYHFKLYGGWFQGQILSRRAQTLITEMNVDFPTSIKLSKSGKSKTSILNVELAQTLEIDPKEKIYDTYRKKSVPHGIKSKPTPFNNCASPSNCCLIDIANFFKKSSCPATNCSATINDVIEKGEQKLVDTMITADLIYLSQNSVNEIAIVSSDDDMWPGIKSSLLFNANLIHIHTHNKRVIPSYYNTTNFVNYSQINMK